MMTDAQRRKHETVCDERIMYEALRNKTIEYYSKTMTGPRKQRKVYAIMFRTLLEDRGLKL